jgi:hypothetical protein
MVQLLQTAIVTMGLPIPRNKRTWMALKVKKVGQIEWTSALSTVILLLLVDPQPLSAAHTETCSGKDLKRESCVFPNKESLPLDLRIEAYQSTPSR